MDSPNQLKHFTLLDLKLTRAIEADPRQKDIDTLHKKDRRPLWEKSTLLIPHVPFTHSLETCLKTLCVRRQIERGHEHIDRILHKEHKGLLALQKKQSTSPSLRVSRLFIVTNDGSERFYRACEKIALLYRDRVLLLCIDTPSSRLTQFFMNEKETLKALLVSDRDAVSSVLFSLVNNETESRSS